MTSNYSIGDCLECKIVSGGSVVDTDESITTGARLVTKTGRVTSVSVVGRSINDGSDIVELTVEFEGGRSYRTTPQSEDGHINQWFGCPIYSFSRA